MFITKFMILGIVSYASGVSVNFDSGHLQTMVTTAVRDILGDGHAADNVPIISLLKQVEELKDLNNRLEKRVDDLEQEKRDKNMYICSLRNSVNDIAEMVSRNDNGIRQNLTASGLHDLPSKCHQFKNGTNEMKSDKMETLSRSKRQDVAVPNRKIAFSAYLSRTNSHLSPNQAIKFDRIMLNDGHGYNAYTGAFVAPVSGTYLFTFHIHSSVHTFARLSVDGANTVDAVNNPHTGTHDRETMSGNTVIIHVGIGQAVSVEVFDVSGEAASSDKYRLCTFSGAFLYHE